MKRSIAVLLIAVLILSLTACGGKGSSLSGTYYITEMSSGGETLDYSMLAFIDVTGTYLKFNGDGTGELLLEGEDVESFRVDEKKNELVVDADGSVASYTLEGDVITLDLGDDAILVFAKEGSDALKQAQETADGMESILGALGGSEDDGSEDDGSEDGTDGIPASSMSEEAFDWWAGGWYGWWMVFDGDGFYADLINEAWDCCAYIEPFIGSDSGVDEFLISIWDEDYNDYYENCISEAVLKFSPTAGGGDLGAMVSTDKGGYFWAGEVAQGDWLIDPDDAGYDNMIIIEGSYVDEDGEYLEYGIVLTKWGQEWNPDATYEPDYYYDYFLPLIEDGAEIPLTLEP